MKWNVTSKELTVNELLNKFQAFMEHKAFPKRLS
jgi:hypothetical protein